MRKLVYVANDGNFETGSLRIKKECETQGMRFHEELREVPEEKSEKMLNWEKWHREKIEEIRRKA